MAVQSFYAPRAVVMTNAVRKAIKTYYYTAKVVQPSLLLL